MASLTEQLRGVNSGKPIVDPGPATPSAFGAIVGAMTDAIPGVVNFGRARDQRNAEAREQEAAAALDEAAGRIFDIQTSANRVTQAPAPEFVNSGPVAIDSSLEGAPIPQDAQAAADDAIRARNAVNQGRMPAARYDLELERVMSDMFQKYPEQRAELAQYFQGRGLDHYMFRAFRAENDFAKAESDAQLGALDTQFKYAAERGLVTNNTSFEDGARLGRIAMARAAEEERLKAEAAAILEDRRLSLEEQKVRREEISDQLGSVMIAQISTAVAPVIDNIGIAVSAAGTDAERQTVLGEGRIQAKAALTSYRGRVAVEMSASGANPEQIKIATDYIDSQIAAVDSLFSTSFEQNVVANRNLAAALSINLADATPIYNNLVAVLGQPAANAIINDGINGVPGLDPEMMRLAREEMKRFDPTTERGTMSLARAIGYLRGEKKLEDLSPEEARAYIRTNAAAMLGNQRAVLQGNDAAVRPWMANYANMAEAVIETAPAVANLESLSTAVDLFASPDARRVLDEAIRQDSEYGDALAQGGRGAAAHALLIAKTPRSGEGPFTVSYNSGRGRFEAVLTREAYNSWLATQPGRSMDSRSANFGFTQAPPSYDEMRRRVPQAVTRRLGILNTTLEHLVETDKYDEAIPNTLSRRERRDLYATGRTPDSLRERGEGATQESEWNRIVGNMNTQIRSLMDRTVSAPLPPDDLPPRDELQTQVKSSAERMGLDWGLVNRLVAKESQWDATASNTSTRAQGLFQINDDRTDRTLNENISDGLNMLKDAQENAQRVLGRAPRNSEVYVMYQQGAGGGAALLNPANASKNAVDVLEQVYGDRRLARQAVTANGGNVNMTAAQFARSIENYFNR